MKLQLFRSSWAAMLVGVLLVLGLAACGDAAPTATSATPTTGVSATATTSGDLGESTPTPKATEATADGWKTFTSDEGGFSIDMPGEPTPSSQSAETALGDITFYFYQLGDGDAQYAVSYNDYPVDIDQNNTESVLGDAIKGAAQGNEVKNQKTIEIQGHTAVQGEMTIQETAHVWYTGVLVDRRLYQVIFYAPEDQYTDFTDEAERFAKSFVITNP